MTAQQLKNSILQLAVQGKLVSQDPNDEPAFMLLERIQAEKQCLIKKGKIKKDKNESVIYRAPKEDGETADNLPYAFYERTADGTAREITDELPFEIPESWEWVRIFQVCDEIVDCPHSTPKYLETMSEYHVIDTNCISKENSISGWRYVDEKTYLARISRLAPCENDIIYSREGSIGFAVILPSNKNTCMGQRVMLLRASNIVDVTYLLNIITSESFKNKMTENYRGIGAKHINVADVKAALIPLPPLPEQRRIIERINKLLPHIANYDVAEQKLSKLNVSFPDTLKKSILQAAVQGKLVDQDPADEPACILLERIRAEKETLIKAGKIKRDKQDSVIFRRDNSHYEIRDGVEVCIDDELPFEIPESWAWARLGMLCNFGNCENMESDEIPPEAWLLELEDIEKDSGRLVQRKHKSEVKSLSTKHRFTAGQVLYSKLRPYLNKVIVANEDGYCTSEILPLDFSEAVYNRYAQAYLMSPIFVEYATQCSYGVKMPRLGTQDGRNALVPLPPLAEQHRIVTRIDALSPVCDKLS